MSDLFIAFLIWLSALTGISFYQIPEPTFGAPVANVTGSLNPAETNKYFIGTTTPSTLEYKGIFTKDLTISGTCTGCPAGGGSSSFWATTTDTTLITPNGGTGIGIVVGSNTSGASSTLYRLNTSFGTTTNATSTNLNVSTILNALSVYNVSGSILTIRTANEATPKNLTIITGGSISGGGNGADFVVETGNGNAPNGRAGIVQFSLGNGEGTGKHGYVQIDSPITSIGAIFGTEELTDVNKTFIFPNWGGQFVIGTTTINFASFNATSTVATSTLWKLGVATSTPLFNATFTFGSTTDKSFLQQQSTGFFGIATTSPTTLFSVAGTSTTNGLIVGNQGLQVSGLTSALTLASVRGDITEYAGTSCTNQFPRSLDAVGGATCATVIATDVDLADLTATDGTLTFSGAYDGQLARTIGLNLGNSNTWTAIQNFNYSGTSTFAGAIDALGLSSDSWVSGQSFVATSTTATSTFLGKFGFGTSTPLFNQTITIGSTTDKFLGQQQATGFFGIATTAPTTLFSVAGTSTTNGLIIGTEGLRMASTKACSGTNAITTDGFGNIVCGAISGTGGGQPNSKWGTSTVVSTSIYAALATKVGIGTTTPSELFSLSGNSTGDANNISSRMILAGINLQYASSSTTTIPIGVQNAFSVSTTTTGSAMLSFDTRVNAEILQAGDPAIFLVASSTHSGFGTTSPRAKLSVQFSANSIAGRPAFVVASSTPSADLLVVSNSGRIYAPLLRQSSANETYYGCGVATTFELVWDTTTCLVSALKFKTDVKELSPQTALETVLAMKPVTYKKKNPLNETDAKSQPGFIADWTPKDVSSQLVTLSLDGEIRGFRYEQYTAYLTGAIQELQKEIDDLKGGFSPLNYLGLLGLLGLIPLFRKRK